MSSILTNNSAMVALQTLRSINSNLSTTQAEISTGKSIGSAKDNAAVWAISKVMEADVKGFKGISDSLSLGESTVAVARKAAETVTDLLTDIKGKIVAAQESNVDRDKIQTDIVALRNQISSVVGAAQFNGLNLVDGSQTSTNTNGSTGIDVLSSLDRKADGTVSARSIGVDSQNLSMTAGITLAAGAGGVTADAGIPGEIDASGATDTITVGGFVFLDTSAGNAGTAAVKSDTAGVNPDLNTGLAVGDQVSLTIGSVQGSYVIKEGDTVEAVAAGMKNALVSQGLDGNDFTLDIDTNAAELVVTNNTNKAVDFSFSATRGSGGLAGLSSIDVSSGAGANAALGAIENMIQTSINASAEFGSVEGRIEIQHSFISQLSDSLRSGIGAMVDADMEAASARLQALQVQQQLGTQALSIANQAPQSILSLFR